MVDVPIQKRRGRPPKAARPVEVIQSDTEVPATVVKPVMDPEHDPNPVVVEQTDPVTGEVIAIFPDAGEAVELPQSPREVEEAKNIIVLPEGVGIEKPEPVAEPELSPQQVRALDHDFDGHAGGSRPIASLTDLQRDAFMRDVVDAYEGQLEVKRTDAFNRVWTFRHETFQNRDHMLIEARRGPTVAQRMISTAVFSAGHAMVALEEVDEETKR